MTLWVSPSSQVLKDKEYFDATFGPFYRTEQFILTSSASPDAPIVTAAAILFLANLTAAVRALTIPFADNGTLTNVTLEQLCYRPIPGQGCVVESALEWFNRTDAVKPPPTLDGRPDGRRRRSVGDALRRRRHRRRVPRLHRRAVVPLHRPRRIQRHHLLHRHRTRHHLPPGQPAWQHRAGRGVGARPARPPGQRRRPAERGRARAAAGLHDGALCGGRDQARPRTRTWTSSCCRTW